MGNISIKNLGTMDKSHGFSIISLLFPFAEISRLPKNSCNLPLIFDGWISSVPIFLLFKHLRRGGTWECTYPSLDIVGGHSSPLPL
jgi:hypothetical protein